MERSSVGFIISAVGTLLGTIFTLLLFVISYNTLIEAELARGAPLEALLVSYVVPSVTALGMIGGILWLVSAYGFATRKEWAFLVATIGCVISVLAGFFPILPYVSSGLGLSPTSMVFCVNLIFFVILQTHVQPRGLGVILFSLLTGMAYVLAFINGVASTHYILATSSSFFIALQPVNFVASVAWGFATISVLLNKPWTEPVVVGAAAASVLGGIPLAVLTQMELDRPSLFWPSPLLALLILSVIVLKLYKPSTTG